MNNIPFSLYATSIILLMLHSMHAWFLWNVDIIYLDVVSLLLGFYYFFNYQDSFYVPKGFGVMAVLFVLAVLWNTSIGFFSFSFVHLPFFLALCLTEDIKERLLVIWTNLYACILGVSFIAWLISWTGALPDFGVINHPAWDNYSYTNYLLCIRGAFYDVRFNSIFLEPGHVAMIAAFTIFANRFDFKRLNVILIFICTLFTFSLAGYLLILVGFIINTFSKTSWRVYIPRLIIGGMAIGLTYVIATSYKNGNNLLNELIIERMALDDEKGIVGNNRNTEKTDDTYTDFMKSGYAITGMPQKQYSDYVKRGYIAGAGYKLYLMRKGIVGTLLMLFFYYSLKYGAEDERHVNGMLLLLLFAFIQRSYPEWYAWMFLYVFACSLTNVVRNEDGDNECDRIDPQML